LTEEDIKSVLSLLHNNLEYQSAIESHQELTSSFQNLSIRSSSSYQEENIPKNHPTFNLPDYLVEQAKSDITQILQEPIIDCIFSEKAEGSSSYLNFFENPLFPEDKPEKEKHSIHTVVPQIQILSI
jgi:hypothetical protein